MKVRRIGCGYGHAESLRWWTVGTSVPIGAVSQGIRAIQMLDLAPFTTLFHGLAM
jgi:hypothetical protein